MDVAEKDSSIEPLPYLQSLADHLASTEAAAWSWFSEDLSSAEHTERVRLELLKATYRIERESKPEIYGLVDQVRDVLGTDVPITLYQMQRTPGDDLNAALFYIPGEAHIAFVGPLLERLETRELMALIGHEVAHHIFLERWNNRFRVLEELLFALSADRSSQAVYAESVRLFQLYKEIFCDRAALKACGDLGAAISLLVKVETGATDVNVDSYLRQTDEIISKDRIATAGLSHPECFVRAQALKLWAEVAESSEKTIRDMIEGELALERMDLLAQRRVLELTRQLIDAILAEDWFRSDIVMAHARLFFDDFRVSADPPTDDDLGTIRQIEDAKLNEYFCYTMLDFAACDRELEEAGLAATLILSRRLGLDQQFRKIATKELKLKKRNFDLLEKEATNLVEAARASEQES